jgi:C-terminal processing protease CtpA/Prc
MNAPQLRERYLKERDMSSTPGAYAAIRAALASLDDPFTRFLEPAQFSALKRGNSGSVTGVGLEVGFDTTKADGSHSIVVGALASAPCHFKLQRQNRGGNLLPPLSASGCCKD